MKHHFGDSLDRSDGYWTIVPNRERYAYSIEQVRDGEPSVSIMTVGRADKNWKRIFTLPNLEELTLHEPSQEQVASLGDLRNLKRLRITHARPKHLESLAQLHSLEEIVFEYVSGFTDLSPLGRLPNLRAAHFENLRRVSSFSGLAGCTNLKFLSIFGTPDWKQPIKDFEFLSYLPNLEVFSVWQVINRKAFPALLPLATRRSLKKVKIPYNEFSTAEYALLETGLSGVSGARWKVAAVRYDLENLPDSDYRSALSLDQLEVNHPEVVVTDDGRRLIYDPATAWYEFLGKGSGRAKVSSPKTAEKVAQKEAEYEKMKEQARRVLSSVTN